MGFGGEAFLFCPYNVLKGITIYLITAFLMDRSRLFREKTEESAFAYSVEQNAFQMQQFAC